jgi:hypothetical protein
LKLLYYEPCIDEKVDFCKYKGEKNKGSEIQLCFYHLLALWYLKQVLVPPSGSKENHSFHTMLSSLNMDYYIHNRFHIFSSFIQTTRQKQEDHSSRPFPAKN